MRWRLWVYTGWDCWRHISWAEFREWMLKHALGTGWRN